MSDPERNFSSIVRESRCYACGNELANYAMLICTECLNDDCEKFETMVGEENLKTDKNG